METTYEAIIFSRLNNSGDLDGKNSRGSSEKQLNSVYISKVESNEYPDRLKCFKWEETQQIQMLIRDHNCSYGSRKEIHMEPEQR